MRHAPGTSILFLCGTLRSAHCHTSLGGPRLRRIGLGPHLQHPYTLRMQRERERDTHTHTRARARAHTHTEAERDRTFSTSSAELTLGPLSSPLQSKSTATSEPGYLPRTLYTCKVHMQIFAYEFHSQVFHIYCTEKALDQAVLVAALFPPHHNDLFAGGRSDPLHACCTRSIVIRMTL